MHTWKSDRDIETYENKKKSFWTMHFDKLFFNFRLVFLC